jgi:hypothetical protein
MKVVISGFPVEEYLMFQGYENCLSDFKTLLMRGEQGREMRLIMNKFHK